MKNMYSYSKLITSLEFQYSVCTSSFISKAGLAPKQALNFRFSHLASLCWNTSFSSSSTSTSSSSSTARVVCDIFV
jgi:hypothetical protein